MHDRGNEQQLRVVSGGSAPDASNASGADLTPFVPRLIPEWMADAPDEAHRSIDGTLVFTDLSGFTAMSERVAALGKVGAEELTDHLDSIFTELITVAGRMGGSMLKFGGDALLILFWGQNHERRAAHAAIDMQDTLGRIGLVQTSAGEALLQMTVGAHSGSFDFFLVGTSHRAMYVCGRDAATTVRVEGSADAGEVRISHELAARLDAGLWTDTGAEYPLLVRAEEPDAAVAPVVAWPPGTSASNFVPAMLRTQLATGVELTEHRQMVVGFLHLSNIDELIDEIGAETTARHIGDLTAVVQEAFARHDVAFVSTDIYDGGPKIVCAAGAVTAFENDEERLLRAVREILDYPSPVELHAGLNRGHGFCGFVGPSFRRTFAVIGDVVNTAARVMSKADAGEMLSTRAVLERSDTLFDTDELPPFAAKGKSEPLIAYRVGHIIGTREESQGELPLVGRRDELGRLLELLGALGAGRGGYVEIVGEPGIGKTRLANELIVRAGAATVAQERCGRYAASTPYFPFRRLLGDVIAGRSIDDLASDVGAVRPDLVPYMALLALPLGMEVVPTAEIEALSGPARRAKVHEVVVEVLRLLIEAPALWFVDDTHWLDEASRDLLAALAATTGELPLVLVVARRPDGDAIGPDEAVLDLAELALEDATALVRSASAQLLMEQQSARLTERGRGNPLFLIELASAVAQGSDLDELPDSLEAVLAARIDSLPPPDRRMLRQLAVIGSRFLREVAEAVVEGLPDPGSERWERLRDFVDMSGDEWRFLQTLVRDTAYEGLSYRERRDVHERTGSAIEARYDDPFGLSELLSLHFHSAAQHDRSLLYSNHAGDKAKNAWAFFEAATFFARSVEAARGLDDAVSLGPALTSLADTELSQGLYTQAGEHYAESLDIRRALTDTTGIAAQLQGLGLVARQLGDYPKAHELFVEALELARRDPESTQIGETLRNIGTVAWLRGEYAEAQSSFEEALEFAREREDIAGIALALDTLGTVALALGQLELAREHYAEALAAQRERASKIGIALTLFNLGGVAAQEGDNDTATARFQESLEIRRAIGDRYGVASCLLNLGTIAYFVADYASARAYYTDALGVFRQIGEQHATAQCLHNLGEIAIVEGDLLGAVDLCEQALAVRQAIGDVRGQAESLTTLGKLAAATGDGSRAATHFLEALDVLEKIGNQLGIAECLELIAETRAEAGDAVGAVTMLGAADQIITTSGAARTWDTSRREALIGSLGEAMGADVYDSTFDVGSAMALDRALELARELLRRAAESIEAATA